MLVYVHIMYTHIYTYLHTHTHTLVNAWYYNVKAALYNS